MCNKEVVAEETQPAQTRDRNYERKLLATIAEQSARLTAAEERERKLVEALRKYGAHLSVDEYSDETTDCWGDPCTCGLATLLAGSKG